VTILSNEICETLIKVLQYLNVDRLPESIKFTNAGGEFE
jgi:hypothetical protein